MNTKRLFMEMTDEMPSYLFNMLKHFTMAEMDRESSKTIKGGRKTPAPN